MIKRILSILMVLVTGLALAGAIIPMDTVQAVGVCDNANADAAAKEAAGCNETNKDTSDITQAILRIMYWVIIVLAVIMIIVGGLMYVLSGGDAGKVQKAKNTIMVAVIGLIIGILASAIINFVIDSLAK